jgi:hypothetical protein
MSVGSLIRSVTGNTQQDEIDRVTGRRVLPDGTVIYDPPPSVPDQPVDRIPALGSSPTRQDARYQRAEDAPVYNPPPPTPAVETPAPQGPTYNPPATQPTLMQRTAVDRFEPNPPQTMAEKLTAGATPIEDTTRARAVNPVTAPAGAQVTYETKKGQQVPTGATGGANDYENQKAYLAALEAYKPTDHNGRLKSAGVGFERGFRNGSLIGGIMGAVRGVRDPSSDERVANEGNIARAGRSVAQEQENRKAAGEEALSTAKLNKELAGPVYEPKLLETEEGPSWSVPGQPATRVTDSQTKKPLGPKPERAAKDKPEVKLFSGVGGRQEQWEVDEKGNKVKQVSVMTKDGLWVSPNAERGAQARETQRGIQNKETLKRDAERTEDKTQARLDKWETRKEKAGSLTAKIDQTTSDWNAANAKMSKYQQAVAKAKTPDEKTAAENALYDAEKERQKARSENVAAVTELSTVAPDVYEAGPGTQIGYYKVKPFSKSAAKRQFPHATQAQIDEAVQSAKDRGQPIIP